MSRFQTLFCCFHCWLKTSKYRSGRAVRIAPLLVPGILFLLAVKYNSSKSKLQSCTAHFVYTAHVLHIICDILFEVNFQKNGNMSYEIKIVENGKYFYCYFHFWFCFSWIKFDLYFGVIFCFFKNMIIFDFTNIRYFVGIYFSYSPLQHICKTRCKEQAKTYPR